MVKPAETAVPNLALSDLRDAQGWSQEEEAERLNELARAKGLPDTITANAVSRWERGIVEVPIPMHRQLLAELFGVSQQELGFTRPQAVQPDGSGARDQSVIRSQREWLRTRQALNHHRSDLTRLAAQLYPPEVRVGDTGLLMPENWRLAKPVPLDSIELAFTQAPAPVITGHHEESRPLRPLVSPQRRYDRYHKAMRDLDRPRLFDNRVCYRLLGVERVPAREAATLTFGHMRYFDMIDVGEALAHELARTYLNANGTLRTDQPSWEDLPFRRLVSDPFDLHAYPLLLSISTLTIRRSHAGATFVLLRRNPERVAIAGGLLSVMPTGVFQPACILSTEDCPDFDLWCNMMREYSEEFLGNPEHDGNGDPIDYANQEPFRSLNQAYTAGRIRVFALGVAIDALNLVGDILTVAIFDTDVFDRVFDGLVERNDEGSVVSVDDDRQHFGFDEPTIRRLLVDEPMAPSGAGALQLAWRHRAAILQP
jgi:transcriptional regulator with XRE-family HTH domain